MSSDTTRVSCDMMSSMSTCARMDDVFTSDTTRACEVTSSSVGCSARGEDGTSPVGVGIKHDGDKPDYSLLPFHALDEVVRTLTYGAKKYSRDNWKKVPDFHRRYLSAAFRHITAHARGELFDPETGLHHLSHAIVSLMYIVEDSLETSNKE